MGVGRVDPHKLNCRWIVLQGGVTVGRKDWPL